MKKLMVGLMLVLSLTGCQQWTAKRAGGTASVDLAAGQKLINVTWKDNNLWILTRQMKQNESPETYTLTESSNLGILEGKVYLREYK